MIQNKIKLIIVSIFGGLITLSSCTKNFDEINNDKNKILALKPGQLDQLFTTALYATDFGDGKYQTVHNMYADAQVQFYGTTQPRFNNDRNIMNDGWIGWPWGEFLVAATTLEDILKQTGPTAQFPEPLREAVAKIWKVYIYMPWTDYVGPLPYSQMGNGKESVTYDSQEAIYNDFFKILAEANTALNANTSKTAFASGDKIYGGNLAQWLKLGNSLRLRAAIRVSKVNPSLAKTNGEAAISALGGLITTNVDNAVMKTTPPNYVNPLGYISGWGEFRMSAAMQSVLQGYNDPREQQFFAPAVSGGAYKGVRSGMSVLQMSVDANSNDNNSNVNVRFQPISAATEPFVLYSASETWFNLAEAALNGWNTNGLTAVDCYNNGITASMNQWGITNVAAYLTSTNTPKPLNDIYNTPALSNIPVLFGATESVRREQIGTQKWLALFPGNSPEAWAEFRRTGFPKLYPKLNNDNPDASTDAASVKRLIFPASEKTVNKNGYDSGVQALGGPDKVSTRLWWNK